MATSNESDADAIKKMYDVALVAFKEEDLPALLDHWEDDGAYLWPAVPPAIGKKAIRTVYEGFFAQWKAEEIFRRYELEISGDLAYSRFGSRLTLSPKAGGEPNRMTLQGIHVYHRRPDGWKFKVVIAINVPGDTP
jgi:ketosteroid isomerase-like protein